MPEDTADLAVEAEVEEQEPAEVLEEPEPEAADEAEEPAGAMYVHPNGTRSNVPVFHAPGE